MSSLLYNKLDNLGSETQPNLEVQPSGNSREFNSVTNNYINMLQEIGAKFNL